MPEWQAGPSIRDQFPPPKVELYSKNAASTRMKSTPPKPAHSTASFKLPATQSCARISNDASQDSWTRLRFPATSAVWARAAHVIGVYWKTLPGMICSMICARHGSLGSKFYKPVNTAASQLGGCIRMAKFCFYNCRAWPVSDKCPSGTVTAWRTERWLAWLTRFTNNDTWRSLNRDLTADTASVSPGTSKQKF